MTRIAIFGATGYVGSHIVAEAVRRGFTVTGIARSDARTPIDAVEYRRGSVLDPDLMTGVAAQNEVVVLAVPASDGAAPVLLTAMPDIARAVLAGGARLAVSGGAGSSLLEPGGPALLDTLPPEPRPEPDTHRRVLEWLRAQPEPLDWFYVSPPLPFGAAAPGRVTGRYRTGGDVMVRAADGSAGISGPDFALAVLDEIERPAHRRRRFTVGS